MKRLTKVQKNWVKRYYTETIPGVRIVTDGSVTITYDMRLPKEGEQEARDATEQR